MHKARAEEWDAMMGAVLSSRHLHVFALVCENVDDDTRRFIFTTSDRTGQNRRALGSFWWNRTSLLPLWHKVMYVIPMSLNMEDC